MKPAFSLTSCAFFVGLVALTTATTSHTATANELNLDLRPGLWEHRSYMQSDSGRMEEAVEDARRQLQALPQSQQRMMEELMASQGISLEISGAILQVCLSAEDIASGAFPVQENCDHTITRQGEDEFAFTFECAGDPPYTGRGSISVVDRQHYQGDGEFSIRIAGNPERVTMRHEGRWIDEECRD